MDQLFVFFCCCCCFVFVVFFSVWKTLPSATLCVNDDEEEMKPLGSPRARVAHMIAVPLTYQLIQTCTMQTKQCHVWLQKHQMCLTRNTSCPLCGLSADKLKLIVSRMMYVQVTKGSQCVHEQCLLGTLLPSHNPGNKASSIVCAECLLTCKQY